MTGYYCKACNAPAAIIDGGIVRSCTCNTTVIVGMAAHARGAGGVQEASVLGRFLTLVKLAAQRYRDARI